MLKNLMVSNLQILNSQRQLDEKEYQ